MERKMRATAGNFKNLGPYVEWESQELQKDKWTKAQ